MIFIKFLVRVVMAEYF